MIIVAYAVLLAIQRHNTTMREGDLAASASANGSNEVQRLAAAGRSESKAVLGGARFRAAQLVRPGTGSAQRFSRP